MKNRHPNPSDGNTDTASSGSLRSSRAAPWRWGSLLVVLTLVACGGGGGPSDTNPPPPIGEGPVDDPTGGENPTRQFTVSGELTANDALQADSDVNDPLTAASDNNALATAQPIGNPAIVKGFVTATPTGVAGDRFADTPDRFDVFRVSAFAGQSVLMEIADFDVDEPARIDLDIGLFDMQGALLVASVSVANSFESLIVPDDADYFLVVEGFRGQSNYTLTVSTEFAAASYASQVSLADLRLDQLALMRQPDEPANAAFAAAMLDAGGSAALKNRTARASDADGATLHLGDAEARNTAMRTLAGGSDTDESPALFSLQPAAANSRRTSSALDPASMLAQVKMMNSREGDDVFQPIDYPRTLQTLESDPVPDRFLQWNLDAIGWTEAQGLLRDVTFQKRPVIAVIDSGLFVGHPDLAGVLVDQRDFVPAAFDGDGFVADASDDVRVGDDAQQCHSFHGTHVATTAVAPQNDIGITGVAPGIDLIGIKVGHSTGPECGLVGQLAEAILYAAGLPNASGSVPDTRADVINMSLGGRLPSPEISSAIDRAVAQGVIVVAAAGNDGAPTRNFPAASRNVIAVAATDTLGQRAPYSSFYPEVDIAAPGGDTSTDRNGDGLVDGVAGGVAVVNDDGFRSSWKLYQGTSMASPTVAAGIALMKGIRPSLTQGDIEALLAAGELTVDVDANGFDANTGFGLMSLPKMVRSAAQSSDGGGGSSPPLPVVIASTPAALDFGASLDRLSLELVKTGDGAVTVERITGSDSLRQSDGNFPITFSGPDSTDGFGEYAFVLDRSALDAGAVSGSITFNLSDQSVYEVPISAVNQVARSVASSAGVFFIFERLNADNEFEPVEQQAFVAEGVGAAATTSPQLLEGTYRFVYGTDTDNDQLICDEGELCGTFPFDSFGFDAAFVLNATVSDATYVLQDVANIALNSLGGDSASPIEPRRIIKAIAGSDR